MSSSPVNKVLKFAVDFESESPEAPRTATGIDNLPSPFQLELDVTKDISCKNIDDSPPNLFGLRQSIDRRQKTPYPGRLTKRVRASSPVAGVNGGISRRSATKLSFKTTKTTKNLLDTPKHFRSIKKLNTPLDDFLNLDLSSVSSNKEEENFDTNPETKFEYNFTNELEMFRTNDEPNENFDLNMSLSSIESDGSFDQECEDHGFLNIAQELDFDMIDQLSSDVDEDESLLEA